MKLHRRNYTFFLGVLSILASALAHAEGEDPLKVKAAYLLKLAQFAQWPAPLAATDSFQLCMLGDDIAKQVAGLMESATVNGKPVRVVNAKLQADLTACRILYIDAAESWRIGTIMALLDRRPTLTISDADNFCRAGGIVSLVKEKNRLKFEINQTAAKQNDLNISSLVLSLARKVY